jgi:hypothetical protein
MNGLPRHVIVGAVAALLVLTGCGSDDGEPDGVEGTAEQTDETATTEAPDVDAPEDVDDDPDGEQDDDAVAGDGGTSNPPSGESIASVVHEVHGEDATVAVEVRSMELVGDLLRVGVEFTPSWSVEPSSRVTLNSLIGGAAAEGFGPRLLDPVNLLEYRTVRSPVGNGTSVSAIADQPRLLYFYFGAPVQEPETLDLHLDFHQGPSDVPPLVDIPYGAVS